MRVGDSPTNGPSERPHDQAVIQKISADGTGFTTIPFDSLPVGVFHTDRQGRVTYANEIILTTLGESFNGPDSDGVGVTIHADDCPRVRESWARSLKESCSFESVHRLVRVDGQTMWVEVKALPQTDSLGNVTGFLGSFVDVTSHHQSHRGKDTVEQRIRTLTQNNADITFTLDDKKVCRYVSPAVRRIDDQLPARLLGHTLDDVVHPDDLPLLLNDLSRAASSPGESVAVSAFRIVGEAVPPTHIEGVAIVSSDAAGCSCLVFNGQNVTVRAKAEARLRENEKLLNGIVDGTEDIVFIKDMDGRYLVVNATDARGLGLAARHMVGLKDTDIFPPDVARRVREKDRQVIDSRCFVTYEEILSGAGEIPRVYLIRKYPCSDDDGNVIGVMGFAKDVTEKKSAEQALRQSEQSYRTLCENLTGLVYRLLLEPNKRMVFFNQLLEPLTGYTATELTSGDICVIDPLIVPDDRDAVLNMVHKAIKTHEPFEVTYRLKRKDGEIVHLVERGRPVIGADGLCTHIDGVIFDITARRAAEQALCESEQRYRSVVEDSPVLICRLLLDGTITYVNNAYCEYFGRSRDQIIGMRIFDLIPDDTRNYVMSNLDALSVDNPVMSHEHEVLAADGTRQWQRWTNRLLFDPEGRPIALQAFGEDVSERKVAQQELARYRTHLEELVDQRTRQLEESHAALIRSERLASIGTLSAGIAHEINNPIGMILLAAENAMAAVESKRDDGFVSTCLQHIVDSARRCNDITRSVLRFARSEPTEKTIQDLNDVVEKAITYTATYARENAATIHRFLASQPLLVSMNTMEMQQVITNLIRNAIQAASGPATVELRTEATDDAAWLIVQDNGPGIAQEHLPHLFDPFFTTRLEKGGTGLGLSIVHGIVTDHGGTVDVRSEIGAGTAFVIEIPLANPTENIHVSCSDR